MGANKVEIDPELEHLGQRITDSPQVSFITVGYLIERVYDVLCPFPNFVAGIAVCSISPV